MTTEERFVTLQPTTSCTDEPTTTTWRLNIASLQELREFLRAIQLEFLRVVDPRESGLLDILNAADLLTETDNESMSGKDVNIRKDQARKTWFLLNKMSVDDFLTQVGPVLLKLFPHIIPGSYLTQEVEDASDRNDAQKECLRHDIMRRIRATTMADMLYHHGCLRIKDYEDIASGEFDADIVWNKMFGSITDNDGGATVQVMEALQALLARYKVKGSDTLTELVSRDVLCTCSAESDSGLPAATSALPERKVGSWLKESRFWESPRSSVSSLTRGDFRSYSAFSSIRSYDSRSLGSDICLSEFANSSPGVKRKACIGGQAVHLPTLEETVKVALPTDEAVTITVEESGAPDKPAFIDAACLSGNPQVSSARDRAQLAGDEKKGLNDDCCSMITCARALDIQTYRPDQNIFTYVLNKISFPFVFCSIMSLLLFLLTLLNRIDLTKITYVSEYAFISAFTYINSHEERLHMIENSLKELNQNKTL